MLNNILRCWK